MAKTYQVNGRVRIINRIMKAMIGLGIGPGQMHMLTVKGRKSGKLYTTPISIVSQEGERYLVAPYGDVGWVKNARAAGEVTLKRGRKEERLTIEAVDAEQAAPVLKAYVAVEAITRPYFDAKPDSALEDFAAEADRHPVFRLG
jgi:deazaflavin-dependent oxidoreductase (nitroreductase family)